jgi:hypothetical protein
MQIVTILFFLFTLKKPLRWYIGRSHLVAIAVEHSAVCRSLSVARNTFRAWIRPGYQRQD